MLPSSFEYHRPATLGEALDALASLGDEAKVLAGGQSLIPMLNTLIQRAVELLQKGFPEDIVDYVGK